MNYILEHLRKNKNESVLNKIRFTLNDYNSLIGDVQNDYPYYSSQGSHRGVQAKEIYDDATNELVAYWYPQSEELLVLSSSSTDNLLAWMKVHSFSLSESVPKESKNLTEAPVNPAVRYKKQAFNALFNLEIALSRMYDGNPDHSRAISDLQDEVKLAMKSLDAVRWFKFFELFEKVVLEASLQNQNMPIGSWFDKAQNKGVDFDSVGMIIFDKTTGKNLAEFEYKNLKPYPGV